MKNKFRTLCILASVWLALFLITMKVKSPVLEGVEVFVWFTALLWFAYWTFTEMFGGSKATSQDKSSSKETPKV